MPNDVINGGNVIYGLGIFDALQRGGLRKLCPFITQSDIYDAIRHL
jgi:hypothetical protein